MNPILPIDEYIPDGEPHVFNGRVYLYGSHDKECGDTFCMLPYVIWSAPADDPENWTNKGVNYRAEQDPLFSAERPYMYAPDCVRGNDGRYYLYYCLAGRGGRGGYLGPVSVAVCDTPDGKFEFYGHVKHKDGGLFNDVVLFDPAVINDGGRIRLYVGTYYPFDKYPWLSQVLAIRRVKMNMYGRGKEVFISEWNSMAIFSAPIHDEKYSACFALKSVLDLKGKIKGYMFWCISDIFEELLQVNRPFHGGYGVINSDGIPKPNFWAFKLLSKLGDERIKLPADPAADVEIAAFKKGGEIQVLVYAQTNDPREDKTFNVTFTVNAEASGVSVESIDDDSCNPKRVWREMGAPDNPTPAQVEEIKARSALKSSPAAFECGGGKTTIKTTLKSNDIRMFTLKIKEI